MVTLIAVSIIGLFVGLGFGFVMGLGFQFKNSSNTKPNSTTDRRPLGLSPSEIESRLRKSR